MVKGFSLIFVGYGLYCLGFYISKGMEIYKSLGVSPPPIPISTNFLFILLALTLFIEAVFFIADYLTKGDEI
jgi:hypothetical protein